MLDYSERLNKNSYTVVLARGSLRKFRNNFIGIVIKRKMTKNSSKLFFLIFCDFPNDDHNNCSNARPSPPVSRDRFSDQRLTWLGVCQGPKPTEYKKVKLATILSLCEMYYCNVIHTLLATDLNSP